MKFLRCCVLVLAFAQFAQAVSLNFTGNFRTEADYYSKVGLGAPNVPTSKMFMSGRALLNPDIIVDDHFSIRSQWSLLTSPGFTPNAASPLGAGQGGFIFGDVNSVNFNVNRAWLEWTSDFGVFRAGRMPFSWGYGLVWDAGDGVWDDWQTTLDRLEYRLQLGHIIAAVAYSKPRKLSVLGNANDADFISVFLQYLNPESDVEGGIIYEKQARSSSQQAALSTPQSTTPAQPYQLPNDYPNPYPIGAKTPYPISNNVLDLYLKKTMEYFTIGGEVAWITGNSVDYNGNGKLDSLNAFSVGVNLAYQYHSFKAFLDTLYASGDSNLSADHMNGFILLHRNRRPGLILGRELLGPYANNNVAMGSLLVYGNTGSFSGVYYLRPGIRFDWTSSFGTGLEVIWANKASVQPGEGRSLGVEVDLGAEYQVYKDFSLGADLGYLFAGSGLQAGGNASGCFGTRTTLSLKF